MSEESAKDETTPQDETTDEATPQDETTKDGTPESTDTPSAPEEPPPPEESTGPGPVIDLPEVADPWGPEPDPEPTPAPVPLTLERRLALEQDRRRDQAAKFVLIFGATMIVGLLSLTYIVGLWSLPFSVPHHAAYECPLSTATAAPVDSTSVRVFNASATAGLAATVAQELQKRGFRTPEVGNDPEDAAVTGAAEIRYGPEGELAARTVTATVRGEVTLVQDDRSTTVVDLVLGDSYQGLRPAPEVEAIIATPTVAGSCDEPR